MRPRFQILPHWADDTKALILARESTDIDALNSHSDFVWIESRETWTGARYQLLEVFEVDRSKIGGLA